MRHQKEKNGFFFSRWFLLVGVLLVVILGVGCWRAYFQDTQLHQEIARLQTEGSNLESKKIELLEMLSYVKSAGFVEAKGRSELNLVKPGEHVAVIPNRQNNLSSDSVRQNNEAVVELYGISNARKWWKYFVE